MDQLSSAPLLDRYGDYDHRGESVERVAGDSSYSHQVNNHSLVFLTLLLLSYLQSEVLTRYYPPTCTAGEDGEQSDQQKALNAVTEYKQAFGGSAPFMTGVEH
jgi:hypothetical protein